MNLRERVEALFNEKGRLMSRIWETERNSPAWREMSRRHSEVVRELTEILQASLQGRFRVEECLVEKRWARVRITNDILNIPVTVRYLYVGLADFLRPPGRRQAAGRRAEILAFVTSAEFFNWYKCEVGAACFEIVEDRGLARWVTSIRVVA